MSGTSITILTGDQFAARIADLFPRGWCSDDAKQPGGNVYAMLLAIGNQLTFVQTEVEYALLAQRLLTETFPELDFASIDFFGDDLPRPSGASDSVFAQQIIASLFRPAATRPALQNALTQLTGFVPRMMEPWSVNDTGSWRNLSYWNVDTVSNPARWGNGGLRYQGYIETAPPSIPAIGPLNPILCWGDGAYWNVPGYFFGIIQPVDENAVNDLLNQLRAYGTITYVKLVAPGTLATAVAPSIVTGLSATTAGTNSVLLAWNVPTVGSPPYTFQVVYRQTGTVGFATGPSVSVPSATVQNLAPGVGYDFEVIARNVAGASTSGIVTAVTATVPPSPAQNLQATVVQANAVTLQWSAPSTGTAPFSYTIQYRVSGNPIFQTFPVSAGATAVTVIGLIPNTAYDFEVVANN
jgi:hypothetical protein